MKNSITLFVGIFFFVSHSLAKNNSTVYDQLCTLNKEWLNNNFDIPLLNETTLIKTDQELIQLHLSLVETTLRGKNVAFLSKDQKKKRNEGLDIIHAYWQKGIFPVNLYHAERTPYFIDHLGTACAVGHIVIETGYGDLAKQIQTKNNYGYISEIEKQFPLLSEWAFIHGFSLDELAWIQPSYSCTGNSPTCYGYCDGSVNLQMPVDGTPPYSVSGPPCYNLCAGTYEYTITDANGTVYIQTYTLVGPDPIIATATWISDATSQSSCDGSAFASNTGGTGPFSYYWSGCSGTSYGNGQTISTLCPGEYKVTVADVNGCDGTSTCISIDNLAGIDDNSIDFAYSIFPNPTSDVLTITLSGTIENTSIQLADISGRIILRIGAEETNQINLSELGLENGCYFVRIENSGGSVVDKIVFVN